MAIVDAYGNPVEPGTPVITIYNSNGLPVAPRKRIKLDSSIVATDDPASDSTALAAAAIAAATESTAGLMSAADKVKADSRVQIHSAAFTTVASVTSGTWTAGAYRRIEAIVRIKSGTTTYCKFNYPAITATDGYYSSNLLINAATANTVNAAAAWSVDLSAISVSPGELHFAGYVATDGGQRNMVCHAAGGTGQGQASSGVLLDTTHDIIEMLVTFSGNVSGWLEVIGYV